MQTAPPYGSDVESPVRDADGFVPPWADWECNEWEACTDADLLLVRLIEIQTKVGVSVREP